LRCLTRSLLDLKVYLAQRERRDIKDRVEVSSSPSVLLRPREPDTACQRDHQLHLRRVGADKPTSQTPEATACRSTPKPGSCCTERDNRAPPRLPPATSTWAARPSPRPTTPTVSATSLFTDALGSPSARLRVLRLQQACCTESACERLRAGLANQS
jgi:hypothetical protein